MIYKELGKNDLSLEYLSSYSEKNPEDVAVLKLIAAFYFSDEIYAKAIIDATGDGDSIQLR